MSENYEEICAVPRDMQGIKQRLYQVDYVKDKRPKKTKRLVPIRNSAIFSNCNTRI